VSAPEPSVRELIAEAMLERAQVIRQSGGFWTDAGATIVLGQRLQLGEDDPDSALEVLVGDDEPTTYQNGKLFYRIPFVFTALSRAGRADAWRDAERLLADVKRAIELDDLRLDGLLEHPGLERSPASVVPRDPGSTDVGISVTYFAPLAESWGDP
jgi:hypothetical protein